MPKKTLLIPRAPPKEGIPMLLGLLLLLLCSSLPPARAKATTPLPCCSAAAWIGPLSPRLLGHPSSSSHSSCSSRTPRQHRRCRPLTTMADAGKGKASAPGGGASKGAEKLGEAEVLNLVLDYLATKGFTEAEQTLRQSVSAGGGSPPKQNSNQQSGT